MKENLTKFQKNCYSELASSNKYLLVGFRGGESFRNVIFISCIVFAVLFLSGWGNKIQAQCTTSGPTVIGSQTFTATGSGNGGIVGPFTYTFPSGGSSMGYLLVAVTFEREHTCGVGAGNNWPDEPTISATWGGATLDEVGSLVGVYWGFSPNPSSADLSLMAGVYGIAESDFPPGGTGTFSFQNIIGPFCSGDEMIVTFIELDNVFDVEYPTDVSTNGPFNFGFGEQTSFVNSNEQFNVISPNQPVGSVQGDNLILTTATTSTVCGTLNLENDGGTTIGQYNASATNSIGTYLGGFRPPYTENDGAQMSALITNGLSGSIRPSMTHNRTGCGGQDPMGYIISSLRIVSPEICSCTATIDQTTPQDATSETANDGEIYVQGTLTGGTFAEVRIRQVQPTTGTWSSWIAATQIGTTDQWEHTFTGLDGAADGSIRYQVQFQDDGEGNACRDGQTAIVVLAPACLPDAGTFITPGSCIPHTSSVVVTHNGDHEAGNTQEYALTNEYGYIIAINATPDFGAMPTGGYAVYAVNYTAGGVDNLNVGTDINLLTGSCFTTSMVAVEVCPKIPCGRFTSLTKIN